MILRERETAWALSKMIPIVMDDEVLSGLANVVVAARRCGMITESEYDELSEMGRVKRNELREDAE